MEKPEKMMPGKLQMQVIIFLILFIVVPLSSKLLLNNQLSKTAERTEKHINTLAESFKKLPYEKKEQIKTVREIPSKDQSAYSDPFDGDKPDLKLVREDDKIIIYSVGPDNKDEGGKVQYDKSKGVRSGGDIFREIKI